jgi:hypothetical protein
MSGKSVAQKLLIKEACASTLGLQGVAMIPVDDDWAALRLKVAN